MIRDLANNSRKGIGITIYNPHISKPAVAKRGLIIVICKYKMHVAAGVILAHRNREAHPGSDIGAGIRVAYLYDIGIILSSKKLKDPVFWPTVNIAIKSDTMNLSFSSAHKI